MFGTRRRSFPFGGLLLIAAGFALASVVGNAGAAIGAVLFLPLLVLKLMFFFFIFRMMMGFFGGRSGYPHHHGPRMGRHDRRRDNAPVEPTQAEKDWAKAQAEARQEIDDLFPDSVHTPDSATMEE